ncbi:protein borderless [Plutella xylostella]|uniref:protein borderless n=1 Tax=Plutella xylostella TaxID=51655 RepID=UPI0020329E91|nr:protein borderless [Plutella xylostella]
MWVRCVVSSVVAVVVGASLLPLDVERLEASVGGFAVLNCHLDFPFGNEIPYHLQWDKDGETIFSWYSSDSAPRLADRWGGRVTRLGDGRLGLGRGSINVSAVRETDAGLYRCRVTFPNRTPPARNNGTFYYLDVDGSNLIVTPPMNSTVLEGERAEFECMPKNLETIVQWYKDGTPIGAIPELATRAELVENGSLVIRKAESTDPGEYECHVQDTDGQVQSASAFLDVQYKAKVVYAPKERYLLHGRPASLDCHFSANPPLTNLRWEKDGFLFDPYNVQGVFYSRNGSLLFNEVDESHEGSYSCTPYNSLGSEGPSPLVKVRVQRPPTLAIRPLPLYLTRLGASITLPCAAAYTDEKAPAIEWVRKDGSELAPGRYYLDGGNLTISDVVVEDRGIYVCELRNEASTLRAEAELLIENVPPRAPYNLSALPSVDSIHLTWVPGHKGLEIDYNIWYRERAVHEWRTMKILSRDVTEATLVNLRPGTEYELRVLSQDHLGDGMFSKSLFVRTLDTEIVGAEEAFHAVPVTQAPGAQDELEVSVRLIDEGALVRWDRDPMDESRCTIRCYAGADRRLVATKSTVENYMLIPEVEDGERYWLRVECVSGGSGVASIHVPEYGRLKAVAVGCAVAALLLAVLAVVLYLARDRVCPPRRDKRRH